MPIELFTQYFLIFSLLVTIVVTTKIYFTYVKTPVIIRDSLILSVLVSILLHIPLLVNNVTRSFIFNNPLQQLEYLLFGLLSGFLFFIMAVSYYKFRSQLFEKIIDKIFSRKNIKDYKAIISELVELNKEYSVKQLSQKMQIPYDRVERAINILAKENKAKIAVLENGDLIYYFN